MLELALVSANRGAVQILAGPDGELVRSAIAKLPVAEARVFVGRDGIAGDVQADRSVHGGVDKAVYAYPADHWLWWRNEKGLKCAAGLFGENLTLRGADERDIGIGDRFQWGDAVLEVSQPRGPCRTLDLFLQRNDAAHAMTISGRCGWYLRVIDEGWAPAHDSACTRILARGGPSVRDAHVARHDPHAPLALVTRVHKAAGLAESWRNAMARKLMCCI